MKEAFDSDLHILRYDLSANVGLAGELAQKSGNRDKVDAQMFTDFGLNSYAHLRKDLALQYLCDSLQER